MLTFDLNLQHVLFIYILYIYIYICMRIHFFWDVMLCHWIYSAQHFEEMCHHLVKSQALQEVSP